MPSFYASSLTAFPPTPPHVNLGHRMDSDPALYANGPPSYPMRFAAGCDYENYGPAGTYPSHCMAPSTHPHYAHNGRDINQAKPMMPHQGPPHMMYGPSSAVNSGMMPLRSNSKASSMDTAIPPQYRRHESNERVQQQQQQQQQQAQKEQKATGGVAAHLDYEMDQMTDFVAEMAHGMYALYASKMVLADIDLLRSVHPGTTPPSQFRKYVSQILSSTRLPSSTILLALYYLASRMRMLSASEVYASGSGQVYRMLTTALLLGSKFLDDNTFQNRSWAEVSNIPVADLNSMELEWLFGFEWKIHERIHNSQDGFMTWKNHWETWCAKAEAKISSESRAKLAPIDTNIQRHQHQVIPKAMLSPDGPIPPQYQRGAWLTPIASDYSPPSAPHTGPNTPDYFGSAPWLYTNPPPYSRGWGPTPPYARNGPRSQPPSYHHTPAYAHPFSPTVWAGHGASCGCMYCAGSREPFLPTPGFGIQPVAG